MEWYELKNIDTVDSPALVLYPDRIRRNIEAAVQLVKSPERLRPHVKTSKIAEVNQMLLDAGVTKFKCATIAEAEMLAMIGAPDILLAYQPVGPKLPRFIQLIQKFPDSQFSCLLDNNISAGLISEAAVAAGLEIPVWLDVNTGMNRSGATTGTAWMLFKEIIRLPGIRLAGIHAYDGHIHQENEASRKQQALTGFELVTVLAENMEESLGYPVSIVAGGSVTFPIYRKMDMECNPGTFVFWDWGYKQLLPTEPFIFAALVITRVVTVVNEKYITVDLGHKSLAPENPLPRVHFLNAPEAVPVGHSEEHMVLQAPDTSRFRPGDVLYGVPVHICPTVSMYETVTVAEQNQAGGQWAVIARNKKITI